MAKFKEMKFWIGDDPELSKRVQEALFSAGYGWSHVKFKEVGSTRSTCFYTESSSEITRPLPRRNL